MNDNEQTKFYVIRTNCYGLRPHVNYTVTTAGGEQRTTEIPTTAGLLAVMSEEDYIAQADVPHVIEELAKTSQTTIPEEDALAFAKEMLLREIAAYDTSEEVNSFTISGMTAWLDKTTRTTVRVAIDSCKTAGRDTYDVWFGGMSISLPCDTAITLLAQLEVYAADCYNTTAKHKSAAEALTTRDEIAAYDYKTGYPERLTFTL
jgi:hypothetical protein